MTDAALAAMFAVADTGPNESTDAVRLVMAVELLQF